MSPNQLSSPDAHPAVCLLREDFPGAVQEAVSFQDEVTITVDREAIVPICRFLKEEAELRYDFLADLCGVDWRGKREPRFEVVYNLYSIPFSLGQYLRPTMHHLPVMRYVHPDEFRELKVTGKAIGFKHVESGPLVRSSYHAGQQARALEDWTPSPSEKFA